MAPPQSLDGATLVALWRRLRAKVAPPFESFDFVFPPFESFEFVFPSFESCAFLLPSFESFVFTPASP